MNPEQGHQDYLKCEKGDVAVRLKPDLISLAQLTLIAPKLAVDHWRVESETPIRVQPNGQ
jgi:hypothetical protein